MNKSLVMILMVIGSVIGGYLPMLFGVSTFSVTSIFTSALGGFLGIWIAFKIFNSR